MSRKFQEMDIETYEPLRLTIEQNPLFRCIDEKNHKLPDIHSVFSRQNIQILKDSGKVCRSCLTGKSLGMWIVHAGRIAQKVEVETFASYSDHYETLPQLNPRLDFEDIDGPACIALPMRYILPPLQPSAPFYRLITNYDYGVIYRPLHRIEMTKPWFHFTR